MKILKPLSEDWTAVIIGFTILASVMLSAFLPELPKFGPKEGWTGTAMLMEHAFTIKNLLNLVYTLVLFMFFSVAGAWLTGRNIRYALLAFPVVFFLTLIAQLLSTWVTFKNLGLETVLFSLLIGLFLGNFTRLPAFLRESQSEFFIKIGLVLLGATILFGDIMKAGAFGLLQALAVVISVWYFAYWIARKLKVDEEMAMMLSSAVSICGVSAAIATAGAIKGDSKKLSYVISLVLLVAIPMMLFMPFLAKWMGLSPEVTGAWLGGTIDTTGAVVASGTIVGDIALKYATIIKFSQNVLLGLAAFVISIYWSYSRKGPTNDAEKPGARIIWERFPKFVLGFILASIMFSFLLSADTATALAKPIKAYQGFWFSLAFVCIGLETRFMDIVKMDNGKPLYSFLIAQSFNIVITLLVAFLLFGVLAA
ncbi:MAG: putative sulfate exporter family transporter [Bacteroidales bacterium]